MPTLTKRQKQIYDFLKGYIKKNGISPTFEEIKKHLKLKAISTIHEHIKELIKKGFIIKNEYGARSIELVKSISNLVEVPLLGTIAAGQPIETIAEKETIAIPNNIFPKNGNFYALRVAGDSMIDENINDGDIVLIKEQNTAENGQKVVALIDNNETTLKKFYKEKGTIRLQPANKKIKPIIIKNDRPFAIQGIFIDIIKFNGNFANNTEKREVKLLTLKKKGIDNYINKVIQGDCLEIMKNFPANSIDMILCDLPYGFTQNHWDSIIPLEKLWKEYERIIKDDGVIALTAQGVFTAKLILSNQKLFKYKMVWIKSKSTNFLNAKKQPLRKHEDICIFYKKQPLYNPQMTKGEPYNKGFRKNQLTGSYGDFNSIEVKSEGERCPTDVIYFKTAESEGTTYHPTQKPLDLGSYLIKTFTRPGEIILDNTCGSGSFLVSAVLEERKFIGIEKNEEVYLHRKEKTDYIKICHQRIREAEKKLGTKNINPS